LRGKDSIMRTNIVLTLTGTDRTGIVEEITKLLFDVDGNVETSRMARLGGEFAVLMLVSIPEEKLADMEKSIQSLISQGFKVTTTHTGQTYAETHTGWVPYRIEVIGADHEGIIHEIARILSQRRINIESMDTTTAPAPITGTPLFSMIALVAVPPELSGRNWEAALEEAGHRLQVDINVSVAIRK
jgi:glycine cleavage system transcriptional repressor